ncbi:hypothetical protein L6164_025863 [Bauhinia variegata]|uniref:Uncharacterized protein n=1 Tax=Bauhinia variegata TaxID=167791 RepID=A0ACB9M3U7_BAUVA|nr:hypothetical protein L6164_025863 [Bauhinia variegata]
MSMANNHRNSPEGNVHASNRAGQCRHACRFCNQFFLSNEELIAHFDSHMEHGEISLRRGYQPWQMPLLDAGNFSENMMFLPPQHPAMMYPTRRNTFPGAGRVVRVPSMHCMQSPLPGNNLMIENLPYSHFHLLMGEESAIDGTMPYIKLLEKPIKSIEVISLDDDDEESPDLSLTL